MFEFSARRAARGAAAGVGAVAVAFAGFVLPLGAQAADTGDQVNLLGFNDFHGALSAGSAFACTVTSTQEQHPNSALLSAGDSVGGTEFASAVQDDEPTIDFLNALGVGATAIGNHEYDQGYDDLTDRIEPRTDFPDLAANVYLESGERAHEPYAIVDAGDVRVAVVGAVTTKTIGKVSPAAIEGLEFRDPVDSLNEAVAELQDSGEDYDVAVAAYHEGASGDGASGEAPANTDPIFDKIVDETSAEVDAIFNGDSHQTYAYSAPGPDDQERPVVQTGDNGGLLGSITLEYEEADGWSLAEDGLELIPTADADLEACAGDPVFDEASAIAEQALEDAEEAGAAPVGTISGDITTSWDSGVAQYVDGRRQAIDPVTDQASTKGDNRARHSAAGDMLSDSMKWYLEDQGNVEGQEVIGWMNPGGIRAELWYEAAGADGDGVVTYGEANSMAPFGNTLHSGEVTGAQFKQMLEEQWQRDVDGEPSSEFLAFSVSHNVEYVFDSTREQDDRILDIRVAGEPIDLEANYTIVTASFLFEGGDNMWALSEAEGVSDTGVLDRDALVEFLAAEENQDLDPDFAQQQLEVQMVEAGEYDEAEGIDTDPVLRVLGAESESLGAPEIDSVVVDAGDHGTFEAEYELNEELGRYAADVELTDWLCVPEDTEVPLTITATPDTGTAITLDVPSFTWEAGKAPEDCEASDEDDADGGEHDGDEDDATPAPDDDESPAPGDGDGDGDGSPTPGDGDGDGDGSPAPGDDDGSPALGDADDDGATPPPSAGDGATGDGRAGSDDTVRGDLARTGTDAAPFAAAIAFAMLAGLGGLGLRHRLTRD